MKLAFILVVLASFLIAVSFAEPEHHMPEHKTCHKAQTCCDNPPGRDGRDGRDGQDGRNGYNGKNGRDGKNGTNGTNGVDSRSEYAQLLNLAPASIGAGGGLIPFDTQGGLSAGMSVVTPNTLTVARSGQYLFSIGLAADFSLPTVTVTLHVNGVPLSSPLFTFTAGASGVDTMSVNLPLLAGQTISFVSSGALNLIAVPQGFNVNLLIMSLALD